MRPSMPEKVLNLEVATGWLQYAGLTEIHSYCIDREASLPLHLDAGRWAEAAARKMPGGSPIVFNYGECEGVQGNFIGRFIAVKLDNF